MSYEIVKLIQITDNAVFMRADSNNVTPKCFDKREQPYFSQMLQNHGREAVELEIMRLYENGSFQAGTQNRYTRALDRLHAMPEYAAYDWRNNRHAYGTPEYKAFEAGRHSEAFADLLKGALTQ